MEDLFQEFMYFCVSVLSSSNLACIWMDPLRLIPPLEIIITTVLQEA